MSSNGNIEKLFYLLAAELSGLTGWILRTFAFRDKIKMLTLFISKSSLD